MSNKDEKKKISTEDDILGWSLMHEFLKAAQNREYEGPLVYSAPIISDQAVERISIEMPSVLEQKSTSRSVTFDLSKPAVLELIGQGESRGNYNIAWGGKEPLINGKSLTECTVAEVRAWQDQRVNSGVYSAAVGKYQFVSGTLEEVCNKLGVDQDKQLFDEAFQDRLAMRQLNHRGYDDFVAGKIDEKTFMRNISKEWAALATDMSGRGYYDHDGVNKARISPQ